MSLGDTSVRASRRGSHDEWRQNLRGRAPQIVVEQAPRPFIARTLQDLGRHVDPDPPFRQAPVRRAAAESMLDKT
jgi:hypothetical protein